MQGAKGTRFVGIDLGKRSYVLRLIDADGKVTGWTGKTTPEGREALYRRLRATDKIAVEACSLAFTMDREFRGLTGTALYILNPNKLFQIYMTDKKTDKEDALKLAKELRDRPEEDLPRVFPPTERTVRRRKIMSEWQFVKDDRTQKVNRLHSVFERCGLTDLTRADLKTRAGRERNAERLSGYEREEAARLMAKIDALEEDERTLKAKMAEEEKEEDMQIVERVPGVGPTTALAFLAAVGEAERFGSAAQVGSFLGFVPKIDCSSSQVHYGHITKRGSPCARRMLVQAAWALVRSGSGGCLKSKYFYMTGRGLPKKKAIVATARKLAELMFTLLKNKSVYEERRFVPPDEAAKAMAERATA